MNIHPNTSTIDSESSPRTIVTGYGAVVSHLLENRTTDNLAAMVAPIDPVRPATPNGYAAVITRMMETRTAPVLVKADTLTLAA